MKTDITDLGDEAIQSIAELVRAAQTAETFGTGGKPCVIISTDQRVECVEHLLARPARKTGNPQFVRCDSFVRYVNEHKNDGSRIYVSGAMCLTAVLDHHADQPEWGQHRSTYAIKHSLEWHTWVAKNGVKMTQKDFCEFIEDNAKDIAGRSDMVELIRTLQVNSSVDYKSFERGDNGNCSLMFVKTSSAKAGEKGEIDIPALFTIQIPAFEGGEAKPPIVAKLRFDMSDAKLKLWYELQHLQQILNLHTDAVVGTLAQATGIAPFYGTP